MVFTINSSTAGNSPAHALSDFSELILKMRPNTPYSHIHRLSDECFKFGAKQETERVESDVPSRSFSYDDDFRDAPSSTIETRDALSSSQILDLFQGYANKAKSIDDDKPLLAFAALRDQLKGEYYSGIGGSLAQSLNDKFGWYDFNTTPTGLKLQAISVKLKGLKKTPKMDLPKITSTEKNLEERVFTDKLYDSTSIGAISYDTETIKWMQPGEYLRQVDPYFKRREDEDSLPFLLENMADLANGKKTEPKFAPLMMKPSRQQKICAGYTIIEHEGRHRALAAKQLGISAVPVAILQ